MWRPCRLVARRVSTQGKDILYARLLDALENR
jgi:hypothetical protein